MKRKLKLVIDEFAICAAAFVSLKVKNSGFPSVSIADIPLNPRTHPVNDVDVFPVYVIISLSIFSNPYLSGKPVVWFTLIISSYAYTREDVTTGDSGAAPFGTLTVCFSIKEISATVDIFLRLEICSAKYVVPYSCSSDS